MAADAAASAPAAGERIAFAAADGSLEELRIPAALMELTDLSDVLSLDAWTRLSDAERTRLRAFLPAGSTAFQDDCVHKLFSRESFSFGSPLLAFERDLRAGALSAPSVRLQVEARAAALRLHRLFLVDYARSFLYRAIAARRALLPPSESLPAALEAMGVDEELLFPSATDNEQSVSEEDAPPSLLLPAALETEQQVQPIQRTPAVPRAPRTGLVAGVGGYSTVRTKSDNVALSHGGGGSGAGAGGAGGAGGGSDDEEARKKKPKTGMKREEKMAVQTVDNPYRLFEVLRASLRASAPATLDRILDDINRNPRARPGMWMPGYTHQQFVVLALHYLEAPPALPLPLPPHGKDNAEEYNAWKVACAHNEVSTVPYVRRKSDGRWEWARDDGAIFIQSLEQVFYFCAARGMLDLERLVVHVPNLKQNKSSVTISATEPDEQLRFRQQEQRRFAAPESVFRYVFQKATTVVAPMRRAATASAGSRARDHPILQPDRPAHISLLAIVRDAAARLPGGVGTRHDVAVLMRDSQYVVPDATDASINQCVSGALDRLHSERDPPVRYDGDQKLWVYLHRIREDAEFPPEPENRYTKAANA